MLTKALPHVDNLKAHDYSHVPVPDRTKKRKQIN